MGFLQDLGKPLGMDRLGELQDKLKLKAVRQFLNLLLRFQGWINVRDCSVTVWGDEIEGHMINLDPPRLYLPEKLPKLQVQTHEQYGRWMIETIPSKPYMSTESICEVFEDMLRRYEHFNELTCCRILTIPALPFLGTEPSPLRANAVSQSLFLDDAVISAHPRFPTLTRNIRERRKSKVEIRVPLFQDTHTDLLSISAQEPFPGEVYMDAMAFGMGMCCLQTTYLTKNIRHARYLYDQLAVISPLFLALSAGTPIAKGKLLGTDTRWEIISAAVDDRTQEQRRVGSDSFIPKSRYSSISQYLSDVDWNLPEYSDLAFPLNKHMMEITRKEALRLGLKVDELLVKHLGFLTVRDFIVGYEKMLDEPEQGNIVLEHLNSTNWNSVRFKPPPKPEEQDIGWRVEFRTTEIQLTPQENACFTIFLTYLVKVISEESAAPLNFYLPLSLVDENFARAKQVDAITGQRFHVRTNLRDKGEPIVAQLTLLEILFGNEQYEGLIPVIQKEFEESKCPKLRNILGEKFNIVKEYFRRRVAGETATLARWMRNFVQGHPLYKCDSLVPGPVINEMLTRLTQISRKEVAQHNFSVPMPGCSCK